MKIKPQVYAKTLVDSASEKNLKEISRNFWIILQKNKQYRELGKILESIDEEAASRDGKILAHVYSKNPLATTEIETIKEKLEKKLAQSVILKNITGKNITGFVVKVGDQIIDLTAEDKINRLKKILG